MEGASGQPQSLELVAGFRYVHEPLTSLDDVIPTLGHVDLRNELVERLRRSSGGAILVSGFRGAGKTTLVRQATSDVIARARENSWVVIQLDVARALSTTDLLYAVMRRLYEELDDRGILARLDRKVRDAIGLAYLRTSASLATKKMEERERSSTIGAPSFAGAGALLTGLAPKIERASKRTDSLSTDVAFLAYADSDVEHDFLRIVSLLRTTRLRAPTWWGRWRGRTDPPVQVIVVFDEMDKLTDDAAGRQCLDELLASLKNILASSGVHFIFVAGADLFDRALSDSEHGNGLFESVFAWIAYVPCLWAAPERLINGVVVRADAADIAPLQGYLEYKARGIPRRLFQELNGFVRWDGDRPQLWFSATDQLRMRFYARLNDVLESYVGVYAELADEDFGVELDRFRLGAHYVLDWVLRSEGGVFVVDDLLDGPRSLSPLLGMSNIRVDAQLEFLAEREVLERLTEPNSPYHTVIGDSRRAATNSYRLARPIRIDLLDITRADPHERAELLGQPQRPAISSSPYGPPHSAAVPGYPPPPAYAQSAYRQRSYSSDVLARPDDAPPEPPGYTRPEYEELTHAIPDDPPTWPVPSPPGGTLEGQPYAAPVAGPATSPRRADWAVPRDEQLIGNGRYELVDVVGAGGMGTVYRARDLTNNTDVAIKMLASGSVRDPAMRTRFIREAEIGRSMHLSGVVQTLDVLDEPDGRLGIVMELLEGRQLAGFEAGEVGATEAVRIVAQLLDTISRIHANGIVRLDIKPANIMLDTERRPVMLDLGLARPVYEKATSEVTGVTTMVGTPAFMAPEQVNGGAIDARTDVYGAACVLYQLLGGDLTGGAGTFQMLGRRLSEPHLPVESLACSEQLRDFVATATARAAADRYPDAESARVALLAVPEAAAFS